MCFLYFFACHSFFASRSFINDPPVHSFTPLEGVLTDSQEEEKVSIVSTNLWFSQNIEALVDEIHTSVSVVDIFVLQEVTGQEDSQHHNSAFLLAEKIGYHAVFTPYMNHPNGDVDFGTAILSRWPIEHAESLILPNEHLIWGSQRMATYSVVKHPYEDIHVISTHLETFYASLSQDERREEQILYLFDFLSTKGSSNDVKILAGDFNTFFESGNRLVVDISEQFGFFDVSQGVDFTYEGLWDMKLDYIFVNGNKTEQCSLQVLKNITYSDHFPLWLSIKIDDNHPTE